MKKRYIIALMLSILISQAAEAQRQQRTTTAAPSASESGSTRRAVRTERPTTYGQQQSAPGNRVTFETKYMRRQGDSLVISMVIDMTRLDLATNSAQILTPVIGNDQEEIELPKLMIQGTTRNKAFQRELELNDYAYEEFQSNPPMDIVKPKGVYNYYFALPYEEWMSEAWLDVEEDLCGCGNEAKIARTRVFDGLTAAPKAARATATASAAASTPAYKVKPYPAYIKPDVEPLKKRREIENAYLEFPRGKNDILPNFGNNARELAKIDKMINDISRNSDVSVQGIFMTGYASPESSLKFNNDLSRSRAEALRRYFMNNSSLPQALFDTRNGGEDWEEFQRLLEEYPLSHKNEIFHIIATIGNLDEREKAISKVGGGIPYKTIYDNIYPRLRRVVCEVDYTVRDFSLEEAKENLAIAPQLLSLNEMYIVANTYEAGSPDFLRVFEVAREEFPDDPVANLNGAAAALAKGKLREAEKYLKLSDPSTPEYANNMGLYLMIKGTDYREAERLLKRAEMAGIVEATANLRELKKKLANINNRRNAGLDDAAADDYDEPAAATATPARRRTR